ncbi:putative ABC transporter ATP-binding protein [Pseudoclavibacter triregionum]|nr:putative ABC transporter ATP-binding protein [Pseudoclavibacter triregionum]
MRQCARSSGSSSFTRELSGYYLGIVIASVLVAAAGLASPFLIGRATDVVVKAVSGQLVGDEAVRSVLLLALLMLVAELASVAISSWGGYLGDVCSARMRALLSTRYYAQLLSLPQRYFDEELTGTIVNRLNRSIIETTNFLKSFANTFFTMLLTTVAVLVITAVYAWPLAVLLAIMFPLYVWLTTLTSRHWQEVEGRKNTEIDKASGRFSEVVAQLPVVKSFVQERRELGLFSDGFDRTISLTREQSRRWHLMDALRRGVLGLVLFGMMAIIFVKTATGEFSVGDMVLLIQLIAMARQPVTMMSFIIDAGQHAIAGSKDYFEVMDLEPERMDGAVARAVSAARGEAAPKPDPSAPAVELRGVSFAYGEGERDVLEDISLAIRPGERVAFIGESGAGKTTLVSLLLGLYPIHAGEILVEGRSASALEASELRERIAVVFQDASLFSGTIRENIAYARPEASEAEIEAAAKRANADAFIRRFPEGYDSLIGERGLKLSGGQRQRIAIARAILKDAPILVLDEATSALDTKSERQVQAGLDALMEGRTSLIIAHRLSTIAGVDRIVTLRDGRVDEVGSPPELAASGGLYAELLALQASGRAADRKRLAKEFEIGV